MRSSSFSIRSGFALLAVLLSGWSASALASDWPTYLNGNQRTGFTGESLALPLASQWVHAAPAAPQLAWEGPRPEPIEGHVMLHRVAFDNVLHVVAAGDRAFFGSSVDGKVYCLDARTGDVVWQVFTDGPIRLAPTLWQDKVYVGSDDGLVYCLDAATGDAIWTLRAGPSDERLLARGRMISRWPIRTGVLVENGVAVFGAGVIPHETVYLIAVDADTGEVIWKNDRISQEDAGRNGLSPQGYLLCSKNVLVVPSGRSLPAAFSLATGDEHYQRNHGWRSAAGGVVGGTKAVLADGQIYASGPHHFLAMNESNGGVGFAWIEGRQLALSGSQGFVADGRRIVAIDRPTHAAATVKRQQLSLDKNALAGKRNQMKLDEFQQQNAELDAQMAELSKVGALWVTPSPLESALIVAGPLVFAGGDGQVAALDAADGRIVWQAAVEGKAGGLAVANGRLFVSTDAGHVYCFADAVHASASAESRRPDRTPAPFSEGDELGRRFALAAEDILKQTGIDRGFCLVLGLDEGRLAWELAARSELQIYCVESDREKLERTRALFDRHRLSGTRVHFVHSEPGKQIPLSNYFANLVVSDSYLRTGRVPVGIDEASRFVKPCGGVVCLGAFEPGGVAAADLVEPLARAMGSTVERSGAFALARRGKLPGAGDWSHQYGDTANTMMSQDYRVRGGLGVLWYGDPGPSKMINRHEAAAAPLSTNGRMFCQGIDSVMAYDAYNGLFLWEYKNPGAIRTGVFNNEECSNLAASDDLLFVAVDEKCTALDAATGKIRAEYRAPASSDGVPRVWGYVASWNGFLFGTSTVRSDLASSLRRRGHLVDHATDALFAVDQKTGRQAWLYRGKNILHVTIAIGDDRVFFIDSSITAEERAALLGQDKEALKQLDPEAARRKEAELKARDVRLAVALDAHSGKVLWSKPVDVTDCSRVGIGGGNLTLMYHDGHVLVCGANANGHYWRQFLSGQFDQRRLVVLDAESGETLWSKDANYRHRPIIVEDQIFAEPWAFDLRTGREREREHPLTGASTKWQFSRPGHHCGPITATPNMLFFRSGFTGYYDLYADAGTSHFAGHRLGCWVNAIPGNGLLMIPEASAGCVCQFSLAATIVLEPRADRDTWKIYSTTGNALPVRHMAVNLGAPGDRRDQFGTLWLGYPRPNTVGRLEYEFDIKGRLADGGRYYSRNDSAVEIAQADTPWVLTSGAEGFRSCELPLRGEDDAPARYRVKLYFAELETIDGGERAFDIRLQGETVAEAVDVIAEAGGPRRAVVREFAGVDVGSTLAIELVPRGPRAPQLCGIEVVLEEL